MPPSPVSFVVVPIIRAQRDALLRDALLVIVVLVAAASTRIRVAEVPILPSMAPVPVSFVVVPIVGRAPC